MSPVKETNFFRYRPSQLRDGIPDALVKGKIRSLADLYRFIGVDDTFLPDRLKEHNAGGGIPRNQPLHRAITGENRLKVYVKHLLLKAWRHQAQQTRTPRTPLKPSVRDAFFDVYRKDVLQTQRLTGVDLSPWFPK